MLESDSPSDTDSRFWLSVLGWAAYLACSWTWCIGMFLPVLLVRDFGIWGFVVFAVPNVVGAAGMGWVLRGRGASERLLLTHLRACEAFSIVTIVFQFFFFGWTLVRFGPIGAILGILILTVIIVPLRRAKRGPVLATSIVLLPISLGVLALLWKPHASGVEQILELRPSPGVLWLAPVCAFGFLLCPYLDMTFHRARRSLRGGSGTAAFTIGFAVFSAIIVLTLVYRDLIISAPPLRVWNDLVRSPLTLVAIHIFAQLAFTILVHGNEVKNASAIARDLPSGLVSVDLTTFLKLFLPMGAMVLGAAGVFGPQLFGLAFNEVVYRLFMAFYGLVFPAYVWLCMIPTRDGHSGPSRGKVRVWLFSVGVAAPMFWMGFIERQTWWLAPGLGVVLVARLFLPRGRGRRVWVQSASVGGTGH